MGEKCGKGCVLPSFRRPVDSDPIVELEVIATDVEALSGATLFCSMLTLYDAETVIYVQALFPTRLPDRSVEAKSGQLLLGEFRSRAFQRSYNKCGISETCYPYFRQSPQQAFRFAYFFTFLIYCQRLQTPQAEQLLEIAAKASDNTQCFAGVDVTRL